MNEISVNSIYTGPFTERVESPLMARETGFNLKSSNTKHSKKWFLMPPCLTLSIIRYGSRVK